MASGDVWLQSVHKIFGDIDLGHDFAAEFIQFVRDDTLEWISKNPIEAVDNMMDGMSESGRDELLAKLLEEYLQLEAEY